MLCNQYVIYQSIKAAEDMFAAMQLSSISFGDIHYINDETAAANLELAQLKVLAEDSYEIM